jgi:hypothetical protein
MVLVLIFFFLLCCKKANAFCSVLKEDIPDETDEYVDVHNK